MKSIGIILRNGKSSENNNINYLYSDICMAIIHCGARPLGIFNHANIEDYFDVCSGFIMQGGDDIDDNDLIIINKLKEHNIPLLGICLGMQEMGYYQDNLYDIDGHKNGGNHLVYIKKDSLLYKIIKKDIIMVNSRHKSCLKATNIFVSGMSSDGVIEAIEDKNMTFFLGVQWHPENMFLYDEDAKKIFKYFIEICNKIE